MCLRFADSFVVGTELWADNCSGSGSQAFHRFASALQSSVASRCRDYICMWRLARSSPTNGDRLLVAHTETQVWLDRIARVATAGWAATLTRIETGQSCHGLRSAQPKQRAMACWPFADNRALLMEHAAKCGRNHGQTRTFEKASGAKKKGNRGGASKPVGYNIVLYPPFGFAGNASLVAVRSWTAMSSASAPICPTPARLLSRTITRRQTASTALSIWLGI